jgi:hypothetical protein
MSDEELGGCFMLLVELAKLAVLIFIAIKITQIAAR